MSRLFAIVAFVLSLGTQLVDAQSLVPWLDARGIQSSQDDRRRYWAEFSPNEKYEFTAEQNGRLLQALKTDAASPKLVIESVSVSAGEPVKAKVTAGEDGSQSLELQSNLRMQTVPVTSGDIVELGKAPAEMGVSMIRVIDRGYVLEGLLFFTPDAGKFAVNFVGGTKHYLNEFEAANPPGHPVEIATAAEKLSKTFDTQRLLQAMKQSGLPFVQDNVSSLGQTTVVCTAAVAIKAPYLAKECAFSVASNGLDFTEVVIATYIDLLVADTSISEPLKLTASEAKTLKDTFTLVNAGIQMGFNAVGKDTQKICKLLKTVGPGMNSMASTIDDDNIRMVVMMAVQQSNKAIVLVCLEKQ